MQNGGQKKEVPVGVSTIGDLLREMAYGNHRSVRNYGGGVIRKAMPAVALGQAMVLKVKEAEQIDGLCISLLGEWRRLSA